MLPRSCSEPHAGFAALAEQRQQAHDVGVIIQQQFGSEGAFALQRWQSLTAAATFTLKRMPQHGVAILRRRPPPAIYFESIARQIKLIDWEIVAVQGERNSIKTTARVVVKWGV